MTGLEESEQNAVATQATQSPSSPPAITQDQVNLIRNMVAKNCTDSELAVLLHTSRKYDLDPLLKEIWCIKYDRTAAASIFVSYHGMLAIANRTGLLDGIETEIEYGENKVILGATTTIWKRGCDHPFKAHVLFREFNNPNNGLWKSKPEAMITKVSEVHALRKAFAISGLYIYEEMELKFDELPKGGSDQSEEAKVEVDGKPVEVERLKRRKKPPAAPVIAGVFDA